MAQSNVGRAPNDEEFATLFERMEEVYLHPKRGDIREGTIVKVTRNEVIIDIGAKKDAVLAFSELQAMSPQELRKLKVGAPIAVCVLRVDDREENIIVSINMAREYVEWQRAQQLLESGEIVKATVTGYNKGGLLCAFGSIQGFVPASQIANVGREAAPDLAQFVGRELDLKVIEVNRKRRRLILSERQAVRETRAQQRERILAELREGEIRSGRVSNLCEFGAFVDLGGGLEGLVHLSELAWARVHHPREVLKVGQEIDVLVMHVNREDERISLSIRRIQPDPWTLVGDKYRAGQVVEGVVSHLTKFGAFVELEPGIEGLVHLSELAEGIVADPAGVVDEGERVSVLILSVEPERHRLSLSLRQVPKAAENNETPQEGEQNIE